LENFISGVLSWKCETFLTVHLMVELRSSKTPNHTTEALKHCRSSTVLTMQSVHLENWEASPEYWLEVHMSKYQTSMQSQLLKIQWGYSGAGMLEDSISPHYYLLMFPIPLCNFSAKSPPLLFSRAGSWSLRALRHESDCGPLVRIFAILTLFSSILLLPSLIRNVFM